MQKNKRKKNSACNLPLFYLLPLLFFLASSPLEAQDDTSLSALRATELFRMGLESYNRFAFNEARLSLEQALS
jgi:hypothetical protein